MAARKHRAAGYVRVSTDDQANSLAEQQVLIRQRAGDHVRLFVDDAISGSRDDRAQYQAMLAAATAGEFDAVYVWKLDRLGRKVSERLRAWDALKDAGVELISLTEGTQEAKLTYTILAAVAEEERDNIAARTRMGMGASAAAGRVNGGPRRFGFEPARDGQLTPRPAEIEVARLIFELARKGRTQMDIARELNTAGHRRVKGDAWTQPKVARVLRDRIWVGELVNQAGTFKVMEPLIDPELFHAVQRTLSKDGKRRGRHSERFLLASGLLRCGACGSAMAVRRAETPAGMREHYRCMGRRSGAADCKQPDVPRQAIDSAVMEYFAQVALDVEGTVAQLTGERDRRLAELDERLAGARKRERDADAELARCDALLREGLALDKWQRVVAPAEANKEQAQVDLDALLAEREHVAAKHDVADATGEFVERITALRAAVAGDITTAGSLRATQVALRRVFDGFVLHRADSPDAPRRVDAELGLSVKGYVVEPRVAEEARLGTMPAGTPVVTRSPLSLAQDNSRPSRPGRNNRSGSRRGTAGGTARRRRTGRPRRPRS
jgi:site-specific DNA recombinase